jgi:hypothetical protein
METTAAPIPATPRRLMMSAPISVPVEPATYARGGARRNARSDATPPRPGAGPAWGRRSPPRARSRPTGARPPPRRWPDHHAPGMRTKRQKDTSIGISAPPTFTATTVAPVCTTSGIPWASRTSRKRAAGRCAGREPSRAGCSPGCPAGTGSSPRRHSAGARRSCGRRRRAPDLDQDNEDGEGQTEEQDQRQGEGEVDHAPIIRCGV